MTDGDDQLNMLGELLEYDPSGGMPRLTDWEIQFVEDVHGRGERLSAKQSSVLDRIWRKAFG